MSTSSKHMFIALCVSVVCVDFAIRLPTNYVSIGGAPRFSKSSPWPKTIMHAEFPVSEHFSGDSAAARNWVDNSPKTSGSPTALNPTLMVAAFAACTLCMMNAQPAHARPFKASELYGTDKRDNKGLLHQLNAKMHERTKLTVLGQFLKDDHKRVELAAKRNGALFNALDMDADKAEKVKAALMSGGLLAGLVIANPGNAFPRPGPLQ